MTFYENFIRLCNAHGKTPSAAAREAGISKSAVNRWKNGGGITDPAAMKLADYFGMSVSELKGTNVVGIDGLLYTTAKALDMPEAMAEIEARLEPKEKPADQKASGLRDAGYDMLTPENKEVIDSLIAKLLKSQSVE